MVDFEANFNIEPRKTITADFEVSEKETIEADFVIYAQTATVAWGGITGTLSNQADLQNALDNKYDASNPNKYIPLTALSSNATGLSYSNTTGVFSLASGYEIPLSSTLATFITKDVTDLTNYTDTTSLNNLLAKKQDTLVSATNIKTINGNSLLGSGNLTITDTSSIWGSISGNIANQTDLSNALNSKAGLDADNTFTGVNEFTDTVMAEEITDMNGINVISVGDTSSRNVGSVVKPLQLNASGDITVRKLKEDNVGVVLDSLNYTNYHDNTKQDVISNLSTIESNANAGKSASDTISGYGNIVTHNTSEFATSAQGTKADSALQGTDVINNVTSTTTDKPLSANMGKELQDEIDNLKSRGRFLALWNCTTGLAETQPTTLPYDYKTGDYFIIGTVGETNYKPSGSQYTGTASTVIETSTVSADDVYYYDGNVWHLQINTQKTVTFANIAGQPTDNSNLASALNSKQDELTAGDNIQITNNVISATDTTYTAGTGIDITNNVISNTQTSAEWGNITGTLSSQTDLQNALNNKQDNLPTFVSGRFLTNDGTNLSWSSVDALPSQSGQSGKYLTTNGTTASWATVTVPTITFVDWS